MMQNGGKINPKSFRATTYPTREEGGMMWVYMNPKVETPPPIPPEAVPNEEEQEKAISVFLVEPLSFNSFIENTFDPGHAPFTHEGMKDLEKSNKSVYSPEAALPIQHYEITQTPSAKGFQVEHSPAYKTSSNDTTITRQFVAPCTVKTHNPGDYDSHIPFVPRRAGETMTIGYFALPGMKAASQKSIIPQKLAKYLMEWVHFFFVARKSRLQFASQDRVNMLGQDLYKAASHNPTKRYPAPTVSDFGVLVLQKWMNTFAGGGPFSAEAISNMGQQVKTDDLNRNMYSTWDSHGKYCPTCRLSIRRLAAWEKRFDRLSKLSFVVGAVTAIRAFCSGRIAAPLSVMWLILSVGSQYASFKCSRAQDFFFSSEDKRWVRTMEVYNN